MVVSPAFRDDSPDVSFVRQDALFGLARQGEIFEVGSCEVTDVIPSERARASAGR
jgi:hypothetical protein